MNPSMSTARAVLLVALGCAPTASGFGLMPSLHNSNNYKGAARGISTGTSFVQSSFVQSSSVGRVLRTRHKVPSHGLVLMAAEGGDGKKEAKAPREVSAMILIASSWVVARF